MKRVFKTRVMNHILCLKYLLVGFALLLLVGYYLTFIEKTRFDPVGFMVGSIPVLIFCLPAIFLHISYYIKNFGLKITIDESKSTLIVHESGKEHLYTFSDIVSVEQNLAIYHKNRIDNVNRRTVSWTPYSYLLIKFKDGLQFYVTSLMMDVSKPPIIATHTYFRVFPYIKPGIDISEQCVIENENYENETSQFKMRFKGHSDQQLNEKIRNWKTYEKAAVEAARQVLAARRSKVE